MNRQLLSFALLCATVSAHAEQVYKWTDAAGVVHYSDATPPKDALNVQTVRVSGGDRPHAIPTDSADASAPAADAKPDAAPAPAAPATQTDTPEARAQLCQAARNNLEVLQSKFQVSMPGTNKPMDDKTRQLQIAAANAQAAAYCQ
jgi:hypothetical protein